MQTALSLPIVRFRNSLPHTQRALESGALSVGFLGGSITDARPGHNWPEPLMSWFVEQFPTTRFSVENAAIGATGSDLAVFRVERDILAHNCSLVFVEYAVNDPAPTETTKRSREGLLRKLLDSGQCDVVLVYTYNQPMYAFMARGAVPPSIAEMETLADHYGLSSVWMSLHAWQEVMKGRMRWEEWLPDGLHPQARGSLSYAQAVIQLLEMTLKNPDPHSASLASKGFPQPLFPQCWERTEILPFSAVQLQGPWLIRRWPHLVWIDQVLSTSAIGAQLRFSFMGRGLMLGFDFGKTSAEFRYRLDDEPWQVSSRERPDWCGDSGWFHPQLLADDLSLKEHTFELEVVHGDRPECTGTNFNLAFIGSIL